MSDTWGLTASMYWKCWSEDENQVSSPKIGSRQIIKSILKILENENSEDTQPSEIKFLRAMCLQNFHFPKF